ncbi:hypothetical protein C9890_0235 [Perkinsus sp. BL_2016]|nr:hypothetical protein C9890_0235 [Perkinsus sp. BL_2016]
MKFETLHHDASQFAVARPGSMTPVFRSSAKHLHPLMIERERQRAVNAAKLERMFAKPLVASLSGHTDGISALSRCRTSLAPVITGAYDGELIFWSSGERRAVQRKFQAHAGVIRGVTTSGDDKVVYSCGGADRRVYAWQLDLDLFGDSAELIDDIRETKTSEMALVQTYESSRGGFSSIDSHWKLHEFVCGSGAVIEVYDPMRSKAKTVMMASDWETHEAIIAVKYNPSESHLVAASTQGNHVLLFDSRVPHSGGAVSRMQLQGRGNSLSWNPREPMNLAVASEDCNGYVFDMRNLTQARQVYKGHVQAVTSIDFSPIGKELVLGSYDKTVRIFKQYEEKAREVYFAKRMQRISAVVYAGDGRYLYSASEDMNLRIWKARASEKLGVVAEREKKAIAYRDKLKDKFQHDDEVRKITKHRYVPKFIKNQGKQRSEMFAARERKDQNKEKFQKGFLKLNDKQRVVRNTTHP